jgi:poly(A) polymerase
MFCSPHPDRALDLLDQSGLLSIILPEIVAMKEVAQPPQFHPEGDVFDHTKKALSLISEYPTSVLAWSVLLHDIGKPATIMIADRIRFNNHDQVGAALARKILMRFHTSNVFVDKVVACIANHMNFIQVQNMRLGTLKKFLSRPTIETELELHRVDCLASHGKCENYHFLRQQLQYYEAEALKPQPFIRGSDLLKLGFQPGPLFSEIISSVYDAQLEETITSREQAIAYIVKTYHH